MTWYCDVEPPYVATFEDQESFGEHMCNTLLHPQGLPFHRQLATLARRKKKLKPRDPYVCPFCKSVSHREKQPFLEHIGEHVQSISRLAHPSSVDESSPTTDISESAANLGTDDSQMFWNRFITLSDKDSMTFSGDTPATARFVTQDQSIPDLDQEASNLLSGIWSRKLTEVPPSAAQGFRIPHDFSIERQTLRNKVNEARVESAMDHRNFVPENLISELITKKTIDLELSRVGNASEVLSRRILSRASEVFAILVYTTAGLSDDSLPVTIQGLEDATPWSYDDISLFCDSQWMFLATIFTKDRFFYEFQGTCPLPFTSINQDSVRMSAFSIVEETTIHPAHQNIISLQNAVPIVAVNHLSPEREKSGHELEVEVKINKLSHPHLMKALAAYTRDGRQSLIFPWAKGGNLRDTWHQLDSSRIGYGKLLSWVLHQLCGLTEALKTLHNLNWRHGDLKPENILRFPSDNGFGTLVIANMGLAKLHLNDTRHRQQNTTTKWGTFRYEHPEGTIASRQPVSRRSDIWSFGCILLELIIWLLYGFDELERFEGAFTPFFRVVDREVVINLVVTRWINHMMHDPRCQEGSALRDILVMVHSRLLVVEHPAKVNGFVDSEVPYGGGLQIVSGDANRDTPSRGRAGSEELHNRLQETLARAEGGGKHYLQESQWGVYGHLTGPQEELLLAPPDADSIAGS